MKGIFCKMKIFKLLVIITLPITIGDGSDVSDALSNHTNEVTTTTIANTNCNILSNDTTTSSNSSSSSRVKRGSDASSDDDNLTELGSEKFLVSNADETLNLVSLNNDVIVRGEAVATTTAATGSNSAATGSSNDDSGNGSSSEEIVRVKRDSGNNAIDEEEEGTIME
ncbi:hypothetical protein HELRODRAFT_181585 [Helobdella robusta]|uniref:Uncharacterized protein n=1 Tax=Helobdella robusta TaxID=6412 RepID=T1FH49_HELRO|nr:hypothetical protein HELRODRAFT_181585 [Helobdella robusta]ESN92249.1 hypothetical protein HELRODRAFT_181585 [Helobdella robusta]